MSLYWLVSQVTLIQNNHCVKLTYLRVAHSVPLQNFKVLMFSDNVGFFGVFLPTIISVQSLSRIRLLVTP